MNKCLNDILVPRYGWGPPHVNILNVPGDLDLLIIYNFTHKYTTARQTLLLFFSITCSIESWGWATWNSRCLTNSGHGPSLSNNTTQSATLHSQYSSILHCHHHLYNQCEKCFHWSRNNTHTFTLLPNSLSLKRVPIPEQKHECHKNNTQKTGNHTLTG